MQSANLMLGLRAMAPIHVGDEDLRGVIDLAIQREKQNQWPVIFASSVKGALREHARQQLAQAELDALFGPSQQQRDSSRAGALLISEARLLALPVPAINTVYKWVTCPQALRRLFRDCRMFGLANNFLASDVPQLTGSAALSFHAADKARIFLREYLFEARQANPAEAKLLAFLGQLFGAETQQEMHSRLLIVSDQRFSHLAQTATAIAPHIRLQDNKTTAAGALWYEESLPCETLMYLPLSCQNERLSQQQQNDSEASVARSKHDLLRSVQALFQGASGPYLRIGANETTGMGWFEVHLHSGGQA